MSTDATRDPARATARGPAQRALLAAIPPALVLVTQLALWPLLRPYAWFLFVPAVFVSAWIGGLRTGIATSALTTLLIFWLFVPPEGSLVKEARYLVPAGVFFATGVLFAVFHRRLRIATRRARDALAQVRAQNEEITRLFEKAKEIDHLRSQFFANVSHELRTPLTLVLGPTEALLGDPSLSPDVRRSLDVVARCARVLRRHVDELLDVAKLEALEVEPTFHDADVAHLARLVADPFATVARERGIALVVDAPETLRAEVDPRQIESVLTNLLSNALKFTPVGGRVRLRVAETDGGRFVAEVADSGPGIPPDRRDVVFERFRQLQGGATRTVGGTGLGLAIARDFVALHRGTIAVDAAPEGGALFRVEIPRRAPQGSPVALVEERDEVPARARQLAEELRPPAATEGPKTLGPEGAPLVLVVEDSRDMSRFLGDTLADAYRVAAAFDGNEGLARAVELRPDLVVTDAMMPGMTGDELVRAIRRHPAIEGTPIVVLTAKADDALRVRMLEEGALDYLTKPFAPAELLARVRNAIERRQVERALGQSRADLNRAQSVAHVGSWRLDVRRNELTWSDESYRIFGVPLGTPMNYEGFLATVHPDDRAYVDRMWKAALRGEPYDIEHRLSIGDEVKWVRERAELAFDEAGELLGGIGTTQDVTDRKRIEDALRAAEHEAQEAAARVGRLLEASFAITDSAASPSDTSVSAVMSAIAVQARALIGAEYVAIGVGTDPSKPFDPWVQVGIHPEIAARIGRPPHPTGTLGLVAREHRDLRARDVRRHPDFHGFPPGHPVMTSFLGVPIRFRGEPIGNLYLANKRGAAEFTRDDQRVAELLAARTGAALAVARVYASAALERAWMQIVVDQMPDGVLLVGPEGAVMVENRSLHALSRAESDARDAYGNVVRLDLLLPSRARVPLDDLPYVRALRDGETCVGRELLVRQDDGRIVPVIVSAAPITTANGERGGAVMLVQDVTVRKELARMREVWPSVLAHELREQVSAITRHLAALEETSGGAPERSIAAIRTAARALDSMVEDLRDASLVDAGRVGLERRETALPALVRAALQSSPELAARGALELAPGCERAVLADARRVDRVLAHLLSNARAYGDPGAPILVRLVPRGHELEVIVTNHGPGIAPDELLRLFQPFERTRVARERGIPGTGLGLYVCKVLVESHGGRIWAESTPGETTSFHFTLPFAAPARAEAAPHA